MLASDGVFAAGGTFIALPAVPEALLAEGVRRPVAGEHIPDRHEHQVRYVGWYCNRARGERARRAGSRPAQAPDWPQNAPIPITCHPVPDIA